NHLQALGPRSFAGVIPRSATGYFCPAALETPATQSGWGSASASAWYTPRLIGAQGAAALEQQRDKLEGRTGLLAAHPIWHDVMHGVGYRPASVLDEES